MKQFFDYAGNEIKDGQEIVIIKILEQTPQMGWYIPATGESTMSVKVPDKEVWELVGEPIKLDSDLGWWTTLKMADYTIDGYETVSHLISFKSDITIIAIKGISDNKEYYELWRKKNNSVKEITT